MQCAVAKKATSDWLPEHGPFMAYIMRKVFTLDAINNTAVNPAADGSASNQTLMTLLE